MELLEKKYNKARKALTTLKLALDQVATANIITEWPQGHEELIRTLRDSQIQRFEYSFDTVWTYIKMYLETIHSIDLAVKGSRNVFRTCLKIGLISEAETNLALSMIDDRNLTSHAYNEEVALEVAHDIQAYYDLMNKLLERTNPTLNN